MICHIIMKEHHSFRTLHQAECNNEWAWLSKSDGKWMKISKEFCGNACYFVCGNQRAMQEYKHTYFPYGLPVNWIQLLSPCSTIWPSYICWSQKKINICFTEMKNDSRKYNMLFQLNLETCFVWKYDICMNGLGQEGIWSVFLC